LAGLSVLEVRGIGPEEFDALLARPLPCLRELNLVYPSRIDRVRACRLFDGPLMQQLTTLTISGITVLADLLARPRPRSLRRLNLSDARLDAGATEALLGGWAGLESLGLDRVSVDEETAARMLAGDGLSTLRSLRLVECNGIGPWAASTLLCNRSLTSLRKLQFTSTLGSFPVRGDVVAPADLPALEHLHLSQTRLGCVRQ
jgi:hypothetical protein